MKKLDKLTAPQAGRRTGGMLASQAGRRTEGCWPPSTGRSSGRKRKWRLFEQGHRIKSLEAAAAGFPLQILSATTLLHSNGSGEEEKPGKLADWVWKEREIPH